jgi:hypothetical protein
MAAGVQEHVCEGVPDFPWRSEDACVKPLGEYGTAATECPIERACDAGANRHHAAAECSRVGGLDEEVRVRRLQAVVDEPEVAPLTCHRKAPLERADEGHRSQ